MFRKLNALLSVLAFLALSSSVFASVPLDLSTGVNVGLPGNPLYSIGGPDNRDNYWITRTTPPANNPVNQPSWTRFVFSGWNLIPGTVPIYGNTDASGVTEYERCFCMTQVKGATLDITYRADNKANFFLNEYFGNPILTTPTNDTFNPARPAVTFQYTSHNGLKVGKNCMRVRVNNESLQTGFALKATLNAIGAQDTYRENSCCQQGLPVFTMQLREAPDDDELFKID